MINDKSVAEKDRLLEIRKKHIEYLQNLILEMNKGRNFVVFIKYTTEPILLQEEKRKEVLKCK